MSEPNLDLPNLDLATLRAAAEHLRNCSRRWDGGTLGGFPVLRHKWRHALRTGVSLAAMELDNLALRADTKNRRRERR